MADASALAPLNRRQHTLTKSIPFVCIRSFLSFAFDEPEGSEDLVILRPIAQIEVFQLAQHRSKVQLEGSS
jgi:hypothetical protein